MSTLSEFTQAIACTCYGSILGDPNEYENFRFRVQGCIMATMGLLHTPKAVKLAKSFQSANFRELYDDCQSIQKDTSIEQVCEIVSFWIAKQQYPTARNDYGKN